MATIDERAEQVLALMRDGWTPRLTSGLHVSEVRVRKEGEPFQVFAYHVMRYLEKHGQVRRQRTPKGLTWKLKDSTSEVI